MREGWKYYNHALIPTAAPHENVKNLMFDREFWKNTPGGVSAACAMDVGF